MLVWVLLLLLPLLPLTYFSFSEKKRFVRLTVIVSSRALTYRYGFFLFCIFYFVFLFLRFSHERWNQDGRGKSEWERKKEREREKRIYYSVCPSYMKAALLSQERHHASWQHIVYVREEKQNGERRRNKRMSYAINNGNDSEDCLSLCVSPEQWIGLCNYRRHLLMANTKEIILDEDVRSMA